MYITLFSFKSWRTKDSREVRLPFLMVEVCQHHTLHWRDGSSMSRMFSCKFIRWRLTQIHCWERGRISKHIEVYVLFINLASMEARAHRPHELPTRICNSNEICNLFCLSVIHPTLNRCSQGMQPLRGED